MPVERSHFVPSKAMYAFDLDSYKPGYSTLFSLDCIWVKKKSGLTVVSKGAITGYHDGDGSVASFLADFDSRYGGRPDFTWDGTYMHAPKQPLATMVEVAEELDSVLDELPTVPAGFEGWYRLT